MGKASRDLPNSEHGLIGDLRSVALVGTNGTIDWYCCPSFDAPSIFGSILDADRGGSFALAVDAAAKTKQFYFPDTNVLITRFLTEEGVGEVQDFMPVTGGAAAVQRPLGRGLRPGGLGLRPMEPARRGHLGNPRRAQELLVLAADVLGGDRTGHPDGQPPRTAR